MANLNFGTFRDLMKFRWGWIVCAASFTVHIGIYSLAYSFSLLFVDIQRELNSTAVETGWIGSVIWGVQMFSSPLGSFLVSSISYRPALILVIIVGSVAIFVSSFAQTVQQLFVTLGAVYGISLGTTWFIMLCVIVQYFPSKNSVRAVAFATLGGTAALFASEPLSICVESFGWRRTLQIIAMCTLLVSLPPAMLIFPPKVDLGTTSSSSPSASKIDYDDDEEKPTASKTCDRSDSKEQTKASTSGSTSHPPYAVRELLVVDCDEFETDTTTRFRETGRLERWKSVISVNACLYSIFTMTFSMLWSVFFVNIRTKK